MSLQLPITQVGARFKFSCELEGASYTFTFRWNERDAAWFMDLGDGDGTALITGMKVILNTQLLARCRIAGRPPGDFFVIDTAGTDTDATFDDLGRRVQVIYMTRAELLEAVG